VKRYLIVIEKAGNNYGAYAPDVDGCIATGDTVQDTTDMMREALEFHFQGMAEDGDQIPEPAAIVDYVEVEIPEPVKGKPR
jgi:predicted RNase H-like HicB family nuclease